nr:glycosyltransferase [uncultured Lichenicoccus sp.]
MTTCAICFTTDRGYLFPTLVAAQQARRNVPVGKTEIIIFSFDADDDTDEMFRGICSRENIRFVSLKRTAIDNAPVMLARLFLDRIVPAEYDQLLYLDGDVQIEGSLASLVEASVPPGHFLAANDPMAFSVGDGPARRRGLAAHVAAIGLPATAATSYFNSGVLRINRLGWDELGLLAWRLFTTRPGGWRFPDQDVLNLVGVDRRLPISLGWNFPIFLRNARLEASIQPRIYHFMSSPKPWNLACPPWTRSSHVPYLAAVQKYPQLEPFNPPMALRRQFRYHLQQRLKRVLETASWGYGAKRARILDYEANKAVKL